MGAGYGGAVFVSDTYFHVPQGRLLLRVEDPGGAELLQDDAPLTSGEPAMRRVLVVETSTLRGALAAALGVLVVVETLREAFDHDGVRIHLDEVVGLGHFVALEAPAKQPRAGDASVRLAEVATALGLDVGTSLDTGYAELVRADRARD